MRLSSVIFSHALIGWWDWVRARDIPADSAGRPLPERLPLLNGSVSVRGRRCHHQSIQHGSCASGAHRSRRLRAACRQRVISKHRRIVSPAHNAALAFVMCNTNALPEVLERMKYHVLAAGSRCIVCSQYIYSWYIVCRYLFSCRTRDSLIVRDGVGHVLRMIAAWHVPALRIRLHKSIIT